MKKCKNKNVTRMPDDSIRTTTKGGATLAYVPPRIPVDGMTPETFARTFLERRLPVVLVDVDAAHTGCGRALTARALSEKYASTTVPLDGGTGEPSSASLGDFLKFDDEKMRSRYLRNVHVRDFFPDAAGELRLPTCFGANALEDASITPGIPERWRSWYELFVCNAAYGCPGFPFLHRDTCAVHAASFQIEGRKRFTLFPPADAKWLYQSGTGTTGNRSTIEDIDAEDVFERYPLFANARRLDVDVAPGDILVVPSNWWHIAKPLVDERRVDDPQNDVCVSVAASFVDASTLDHFLDAHCEFRAMQSLVTAGAATMT